MGRTHDLAPQEKEHYNRQMFHCEVGCELLEKDRCFAHWLNTPQSEKTNNVVDSNKTFLLPSWLRLINKKARTNCPGFRGGHRGLHDFAYFWMTSLFTLIPRSSLSITLYEPALRLDKSITVLPWRARFC